MLFNDMPDDCLRQVFKQLALSQMLPIRAVCTKWQTLIESMCLSRTSLKLFFKEGDLVSYCKDLQKYNLQDDVDFRLTSALGGHPDDVLFIPNGSHPEIGLFLSELFPMVTNLVYCLYNWDTLIFILNKLAPRLQALTVLDMLPDDGPKKDTTFATIDSLTSLRRLHLFYLFLCEMPRPLRIMSQLERLALAHYTGDITPVLGQLGARCKKLQVFSCHCSTREDLLREKLFSVELAESLTHLALYSTHLGCSGDDLLNELLANCKAIEYIDLDYFGFHFANILGALSRCTTLTELRCSTSHFVSESSIETLPPVYQQYHVPSLKRLTLLQDDLNEGEDIDHYYRVLPALFPNLQVLTIRYYNHIYIDSVRELFFNENIFADRSVTVKYERLLDCCDDDLCYVLSQVM